MSRGAGSGSPFVDMGFIRMRRVRGLERWVGGWSRRGGRGSRSCQVSPGGRGWRQVQRAGRGLERTRVLTVREDLIQQSGGDRGSVTSGVQTSRSEMSEEGWGVVPSCSGHARSRSQTGRPSCRTTEVGLEAPQLSPRIDVENPLSERLDPAFAVRACRIPENTSLALTLQIKDHFSNLRASWSRSESIRPWEHTAPLLAARVTRVSPGDSFLVVHPSLRVSLSSCP